jgi:DNA-directed RNA polymerase subunit RPC12/RpoP
LIRGISGDCQLQEEAIMPAKRTRQEARDRLRKVFEAELDRLVPADPSVPTKGRTFRDFEMQGVKLKQTLLPTVLEELAGLSESAEVKEAGRCPHCGSDRTYLEKEVVPKEVRSPDGPAVLDKQQARCRACGGSFSPSGS